MHAYDRDTEIRLRSRRKRGEGGGRKATPPHPFPIYACNIGYGKFACVQSHTYRRTLSLDTRITTSARKTETFALLVQ